MATNEKYNGWTNYETWNWALWINNDQYSQEYWDDVAIDCLKNFVSEYEWQTDEQAAITELSYRLQYDMDEQAEQLNIVTGPFSDILNAGLSRVNWYEIAESIIESVKARVQ